MKIKLRTLIESIGSIESPGALHVFKALMLNASSSFKVSKALKILDEEAKAFNDVKNKRIMELGEEIKEKGEPTGKYKIKPENDKMFKDEMNELLDKELEFKEFPEITSEDLKGAKVEVEKLDKDGNRFKTLEDAVIEPDMIMQLEGWFIKE